MTQSYTNKQLMNLSLDDLKKIYHKKNKKLRKIIRNWKKR